MQYKIINAISSASVPLWGNKKQYIAIHYLGVVGQSHELASDGTGAHYYIYWDGTIYQRCSHDAVVWNLIRRNTPQVGGCLMRFPLVGGSLMNLDSL